MTTPKLTAVTLTQDKTAHISHAQAARVQAYNWYAVNVGDGRFYAATMIDSKAVYLHVFIMQPAPGMEIDHIDGDGLNCRDDNLRQCTHAQNMHNRKMPSNNTSGFVDYGSNVFRDITLLQTICNG